MHDMKVESLVCPWGQAFSLPPAFCPAYPDHPKRRRLKAGGRLKAWPHIATSRRCISDSTILYTDKDPRWVTRGTSLSEGQEP